MTVLILLVVLSVPGPADAGRVITHDVATLLLARALELEGRPHRYRVRLDSTAWEDGPTVSYDAEAPHGPARRRPPAGVADRPRVPG
jgi:hypothetical protein